MTNTYMTAGEHTPEEIIASVKNGVYAVSFGGGQVDITSGKFVFGCTEAYMIENGKVTQPIKGAMLIGNGPDAMHRVTMVGNDMKLDTGIGMCGKAGQGVPVGVGQPHLRMNQMTVAAPAPDGRAGRDRNRRRLKKPRHRRGFFTSSWRATSEAGARDRRPKAAAVPCRSSARAPRNDHPWT